MRCTAIVVVVALISMSSAYGQAVEIESFDGNGTLTWSAPSGSVSTVQWADRLTGSSRWRQSWLDLQDQVSTGGVMSAEVPMFYRITCWTNGTFSHPKIGRTYYYSISNALGEVTTGTYSVVGMLELPMRTNRYFAVRRMSPSEVGFHIVRADQDALYEAPHYEGFLHEYALFRNAPVGTTWTSNRSRVS